MNEPRKTSVCVGRGVDGNVLPHLVDERCVVVVLRRNDLAIRTCSSSVVVPARKKERERERESERGRKKKKKKKRESVRGHYEITRGNI